MKQQHQEMLGFYSSDLTRLLRQIKVKQWNEADILKEGTLEINEIQLEATRVVSFQLE